MNSGASADQVAQSFGKTIPEIEQWVNAMQQNIDSGNQVFRAYGPVVKAFTDNFHSLGMLGFTPFMGQGGVDAFRDLGKRVGLNEEELYLSANKIYGKAQPYSSNIIGYGTNYEKVMQKTIANALTGKGQKDQADRFVSATQSWVDQGAQQAQNRQVAWDQQVKAMNQGGPSIWNAIGLSLAIATGGWLGALGLSTGTAVLDALINQAITQQITNGKIDPESLIISAAFNQAVPVVSEALQEAGVSPDIAKMIVKTGAGAIQGGVPGALVGAGSETIESLTKTPGTTEKAGAATPETPAAPEVPLDVYAPTGEMPTPEVPATPEVTPPFTPAESVPGQVDPGDVPVLGPDGQPLKPSEVPAQYPELYPNGRLPKPGEETTYFPTGEAITAEKPVYGQVEPQDLPAYDESGTALTPDQVAEKYPDLYPGGKLPQEGEVTKYSPGEPGIKIPGGLLSQIFNLGMKTPGGGGGGPGYAYGSTAGMFGGSTSPSKAMGEGDIESSKTGGKRRNVWNVASLRNLQEGLGV